MVLQVGFPIICCVVISINEFSGTCNMSGNVKQTNVKGRILSQDIESSVKEILEESAHN